MKRTIVIGDIHGRDVWKKIIEKEGIFSIERVIFIGDYWDSFDINFLFQKYNFLEIMNFKKDHPALEVICLIGNHDFHYMDVNDYGRYSGFQEGPASEIQYLLKESENSLQIAYSWNNFLFTHAGVSKIFLEIKKLGTEENTDRIANELNDLFKYKPNEFGFVGRNPYGDEKYASPIWIRPFSLEWAGVLVNQVVGHTGQTHIDITERGGKDGVKTSIYYIDTLGQSEIEYLVWQNDEKIPTLKVLEVS